VVQGEADGYFYGRFWMILTAGHTVWKEIQGSRGTKEGRGTAVLGSKISRKTRDFHAP